jgi:hypothetical protein
LSNCLTAGEKTRPQRWTVPDLAAARPSVRRLDRLARQGSSGELVTLRTKVRQQPTRCPKS